MTTTRFAHHRLDAFHVARGALVAGDALVKKLSRGVQGARRSDAARACSARTSILRRPRRARDTTWRRRVRCARAECSRPRRLSRGHMRSGLVGEERRRTGCSWSSTGWRRCLRWLRGSGGSAGGCGRPSGRPRLGCAAACAVAARGEGLGESGYGERGSRRGPGETLDS